MICQVDCSGNAYSLAVYAPNQFVWNWVDGSRWQSGLRGVISDGLLCGAAPRVSVVVLLCSPKAVTPVYMTVVESPQCTYTFTVYTYIVCVAPTGNPPTSTPIPTLVATDMNAIAQSGMYYPIQSPLNPNSVYPVSSCAGLGYDFSSLSTQDLTGYDARGSGWRYVLRLCGVTSDLGCQVATNPNNTMFCQADGYNQTGGQCNANDVYSVAEYDPSKVTWSYINGVDYRKGVRMTIPGTSACNAGTRQGVIDLVCDPYASNAQISTVLESPACTYRAVVMTNIVCSAPSGSGSSDSLSSGQIAATVVVPVIVAIICAVICLFCLLSTRRMKSTN